MEKVVLCSVSPDEYLIKRPGLNYDMLIPACPVDESYSTFTVESQDTAMNFYADLTPQGKTSVPFHVSAETIVKDIFRSESLESKGVFVPNGDKPTEKELAEARRKRRALLAAWIKEGDILFSRYGSRGIQHIEDKSKRAVIEMKEVREWVFNEGVRKAECEGCGASVKLLSNGTLPAVCPSCHAILDREKAIRLGLAEEIHTEEKKPRRKTEPEAVTA